MPKNNRAPMVLIIIMIILITIASFLVYSIIFSPQTITKMFVPKNRFAKNYTTTPTPTYSQRIIVLYRPTLTPTQTQEKVNTPSATVTKTSKPPKKPQTINSNQQTQQIEKISQALSSPIPITDVSVKPLKVVVNKEKHTMEIIENKTLLATYKVTIGKEDEKNKTNPGVYSLGEIVYNSPWYPPERIVRELEESGEDLPLLQEIKQNKMVRPYEIWAADGKFTKQEGNLNPIGPIWIDIFWQSDWSEDDPGIAESGLGIHGTNEPDKIGGSWGHGCIRMKNEDIKELVSKIEAVGGVSNTVLIIKSSEKSDKEEKS